MMSLYGTRELIDGIRAVRAGTIQMAHDFSAEDYDFRPTPESRSVSETLVHVAWLWSFDRYLHEEAHLDTLDGFDFPALIEKSFAEERKPRSKAEIVEMLRLEGEQFVDWLGGLRPELLAERVGMPGGASTSRFELLLGTKEHEMHHRAQLTVLKRLVGGYGAPMSSTCGGIHIADIFPSPPQELGKPLYRVHAREFEAPD